MQAVVKISMQSVLWLAFFASILFAWWTLYSMSLSMNLDLFGRSFTMDSDMGKEMAMGISMSTFGPLFGMWAIMMAAMMMPTMVPTLTSYEDLINSADGTRAGWLGVILGYMSIWMAFAAVITGLQLSLLSYNVVDMMGAATSVWLSVALLLAAGAYQFTCFIEACHGVCHIQMMYFISWFAHGAWIGGFLRWLLYTFHGAWICGWRDEFFVDGFGHAFYGYRKTTSDWPSGNAPVGCYSNHRRDRPCYIDVLRNGEF